MSVQAEMLSERIYSRLYDNSFLTREFGYFPKFEGVYIDDPKELNFEFYQKPWNSFQRRRIHHASRVFFPEFNEKNGEYRDSRVQIETNDDRFGFKIPEKITKMINSERKKLFNKDELPSIKEDDRLSTKIFNLLESKSVYAIKSLILLSFCLYFIFELLSGLFSGIGFLSSIDF